MNSTQLGNGSLRLQVEVTIQAGPRPSGYNDGVNTRFMTLMQENGSWRIDDIATAPSPAPGPRS